MTIHRQLEALNGYKMVADISCVSRHKYLFSSPSNQSETKGNSSKKNLQIQ
jgi:hypothetical protein